MKGRVDFKWYHTVVLGFASNFRVINVTSIALFTDVEDFIPALQFSINTKEGEILIYFQWKKKRSSGWFPHESTSSLRVKSQYEKVSFDSHFEKRVPGYDMKRFPYHFRFSCDVGFPVTSNCR